MHKNCVALLLCLLAFPLFLTAQPACPANTMCFCSPEITGDPLQALKDGNLRYAGSEQKAPDPKHLHQSVQCGNSLFCCQKPFAVILSCSDSRVPPEVLFDLGNGDLFVVREAGNIATPASLGSIEYAVGHFKTNLVVVMGHKRCGAVEAAFCRNKPAPHIDTIWTLIQPAVKGNQRPSDCSKPPNIEAERWNAAVEKNVTEMAKIVKNDLERVGSNAKVVPAYYDLENGKVTFLPGAPNK
jgi:carbonic anhydrase